MLRQVLKSGLQMSIFNKIRSLIAKDHLNNIRLYEQFISSVAASVTGQIISNPADVLKIRLMCDGKMESPRYNGLGDAIKSIYSEAGILGFWKGTIPSCQRSAFSSGTALASYSHMKQTLTQKGFSTDGTLSHMGMSAVSSALSTMISAPFDFAKTRMINQCLVSPQYSGTFDCLRTSIANEGILTLFKGVVPNFTRIFPWQMIFFVTYENLNRICHDFK
jgi:hypothetical protein